jgi:hypothetical protein
VKARSATEYPAHRKATKKLVPPPIPSDLPTHLERATHQDADGLIAHLPYEIGLVEAAPLFAELAVFNADDRDGGNSDSST